MKSDSVDRTFLKTQRTPSELVYAVNEVFKERAVRGEKI